MKVLFKQSYTTTGTVRYDEVVPDDAEGDVRCLRNIYLTNYAIKKHFTNRPPAMIAVEVVLAEAPVKSDA